MNDELDFREFLGLYDLMDIKEKLFEFTLYNPDSDLEYDFISVEEKNVSYLFVLCLEILWPVLTF